MSAITVSSQEYIEYTPGADFPTGTVFVLADLVCYCEQPLKTGVKGALRVSGVVEVNADTPALTQGTIVYWDAGAFRVTTTVGANKRAGLVAADKAINLTRARILLGR